MLPPHHAQVDAILWFSIRLLYGQVAFLAQPGRGGATIADPQLVLGVGEPVEMEDGHRVVPCSYLLARISVFRVPLVHAMSVARGTDIRTMSRSASVDPPGWHGRAWIAVEDLAGVPARWRR
jgi:hypothetical protein